MTEFATIAFSIAPNTAVIGPDVNACKKKVALDVIKGAVFFDQVDWLSGKLTDGLLGGSSSSSDPGLPSIPGSSTIGAASSTSSFIASSQIAQAYVRQAVRAGGGSISLRRVGKLSGMFGKYAGVVGTALTAYSAYKDFQHCVGE